MQSSDEMNIAHEVRGDTHIIQAQYRATDGHGQYRPVMWTIIQFLCRAGMIIYHQRAVFDWSGIEKQPAIVDLNLVVRARPADGVPPVCEPQMPLSPLSQKV